MKVFTKQFHDKCAKQAMDMFLKQGRIASLIILDQGEKNLVAEHRGTVTFPENGLESTPWVSPILFHKDKFWVRSNEYGHALDFDRPKDKSAPKCHTEREAFAYWIKQIEEAESQWHGKDIQLLWTKPYFYVAVEEPKYSVLTFGFNNGTAIFVEHSYNPNVAAERYFNVKDLDKAKALAKKIAKKRGDKEPVGFYERIKIIDPSVFTAKPLKEHTNVDSFSKSLNGIAESGLGPIGGLLAMGLAIEKVDGAVIRKDVHCG